MHIRDFERSDVPYVADINCGAFYNTVITAHRYPYRAQYPLAFRAVMVKKQRSMLSNPSAYGFVCVADDEDIATLQRGSDKPAVIGTILGYAWWVREGSSPTEDPWTKGRHVSLSYKLERTLRRLEDLYETYVNPNLAESQQNIRQLGKARRIQRPFARLRHTAHWYLNSLAVGPDFQNRGVGRMLVSWGMARLSHRLNANVEADTMPAESSIITLVATSEGKRLYEKLGFKVLCDSNGGESSLNLPGLQDFAMIMDPKTTWIKDIDDSISGEAEQPRGYVRWKDLTNSEIAQINAFGGA